jgi:hypothetical protein
MIYFYFFWLQFMWPPAFDHDQTGDQTIAPPTYERRDLTE